MSHKEEVLKYLQSGKKLTPLEALNYFGCFRLGARICELREAGYQIINESKYGSFAVYSIELENK
mgnify:CR=1 FL=1